MDCKRSSELISLAIDQMISSEDSAELEIHLLSCECCKEEYELLQSIQQSLTIIGTEEAELPSGFHTELMQRIKSIEVQAHDEVVTKDKSIPLWRRVNQKYMNLAAVMVLVVVFALIGVINLDNIRQSNDSAVMEKATSTESMKESFTTSAPMMEAAPEAVVMEEAAEESASDMEKSDGAQMAAEAPQASLQMDADEMTTEETTSSDTSVTNEMDEAGDAPLLESVMVEETEEIALTYEVNEDESLESEFGVAESGNQLARESKENQKTTRSIDDTIELTFDERMMNDHVPEGLGFMIIGGFLGFMLVSVVVILRKLR